jgi:hypothetical protein
MNMRNGKVQFVLVAVLLISVGVLLVPSMTHAKPKSMPWQEPQEQRDGYSRSFVVDANGPLIEVPEGKCYVLLSLYARATDYEPPYFEDYYDGSFWTLTIDGETFLDEYGLFDPSKYVGTGVYLGGILKEDFPDKCVVVNSGETLGIIRPDAIDKLSMTLIGYFYNTP